PDDLKSGVLPGPSPQLGDPAGMRYYEITIAIQDRAFTRDGALFYPSSRAYFDEADAYTPDTDVSPYWNPEFFGNAMMVNGRTWPYLRVEPRRYRFRLLNGCNSRFLVLKLARDPLAARPATPVLPFWQIGSDGGFLPAPVELGQLLMGPAERADVIVDFTGVPPGTRLYLINEGPDEPFAGGRPLEEFEPSDPHSTGQVLELQVVPLASTDASTPPARLTLPAFRPLGPAGTTRRVSLNEATSSTFEDAPIAAFLGTLDGSGSTPLDWDDPITENPALGATEIWEIHNFTADAHPIHIHEVQFQVVNREKLPEEGGARRGPEPWETGDKDTAIAYPGEITRVNARFDLAGRYAWHCHILEHEDNEMMRPYRIGP
ncbi:MAG: multicopper oxidase domain-containing protein, partial [Thermomicrobiaceae bacterium]|nr:multicopper oxidase domain-containing protein [Thermomicrobiaceae bacterium]